MADKIQFKKGQTIKDLNKTSKQAGTFYLTLDTNEMYCDLNNEERIKIINRDCLKQEKSGSIVFGVIEGGNSSLVGAALVGAALVA